MDDVPVEAKKRLKREANRRSAQLSRARKKAFIEDLKAQNAEYQKCELILACHPDLIFAFDALGMIDYANPRACMGLGRDLNGVSFFELLADESRLRVQSALQQVMSRGGLHASIVFEHPLDMAHKDGSRVKLDVLGECTRSRDDQWLVVCAARPTDLHAVVTDTSSRDSSEPDTELAAKRALDSLVQAACSSSSSEDDDVVKKPRRI